MNMFYFKSRAAAGRSLAQKLAKKSFDKRPIVFCLSEGGVLVGAELAMALHADMVLYKIKDIFLPNEHEATAGLSSTGTFRYNDLLSAGQIEELAGEFHTYIDEQKMQKFHELNVLLGNDGEIDRTTLHHRDIIVVGDALQSGFAVMMATDFLKTVAIRKVIAAVPVVSVSAIDQLHVIADELFVLGVTQNFISTDHYFEDEVPPTTEQSLRIIHSVNAAWRSGVGNEIIRLQQAAETGRKRRREFLHAWKPKQRGGTELASRRSHDSTRDSKRCTRLELRRRIIFRRIRPRLQEDES